MFFSLIEDYLANVSTLHPLDKLSNEVVHSLDTRDHFGKGIVMIPVVSPEDEFINIEL